MSDIIIKGMEMPTTGLYFVSVDNAGGRDKTVVTVERMLGNRDVRQVVGSFELVPVPPHGRCIDADALHKELYALEYARENEWLDGVREARGVDAARVALLDAPTIIPAEEGET